ncbi:hypothetical protein [Gilliamella apicola]|uniref:hypothetical protein n=1 Tax=Gilliamella apicola TaxID=1196095 RepID=UPI002FEE1C25
MRIVITIFVIFFLTACHTRTSEEAYKEGKYLESISLLTNNIEEKGLKKYDKDKAEKLRTLVTNVMEHYETNLANTSDTDYKKRIDIYQNLLKMKMMLRDRFYSSTVDFFNNKYDSEQLEQTIAKQYYDYANSITGTDSISYKNKANLYQRGLERYNYKDIEKRYQNANTKYMQVAAKEYYDLGKKFAQEKNYKEAATAFSNASQVYQPLGKYRDSDKRAIENDKKYCTQQAEAAYQQAQQLSQNARKRHEFREVADYFNKAVKVYQPYGKYRDAKALAETYQKKGIVKVYYNSSPSQFTNEIREYIGSYYIEFTNYLSEADIDIRIDYDIDFNDLGKSANYETKTEQVFDKYVEVPDKKGRITKLKSYKDQRYTIETETHSNQLTLTTNIMVNGMYSYIKSFKVKETSAKYKYIYSGDVPSKYRNYSEGSLKSQDELYKQAQQEQLTELRSRLKDIANDLSYL